MISIITARGGSKRLPRKNILNLAGKPLIAWTIECSLMAETVLETFVSTDDEEIAEIARKWGAKVIYRPDSLAEDQTKSEDVLLHALRQLKKTATQLEYGVLLQPTSPLRLPSDIDDAYALMIQRGADRCISVEKKHPGVLKSFIINEVQSLEPVRRVEDIFSPDQLLPDVYRSNGALYIFQISSFLASKSLYSKTTHPHIMPRSRSIDIDNEQDFKEAERLIKGDVNQVNDKEIRESFGL